MQARENELVRITPETLTGTWDYKCKTIVSNSNFPNEILFDNKNLKADIHGGQVDFAMKGQSVAINSGQRTWRNQQSREPEECEQIEPALSWEVLHASVLLETQLIYQYKIPNTYVNGISHVYMTRDWGYSEKLKMEGWFFYVPDSSLMEAMYKGELAHGKHMVNQKTKDFEWLKLFGRVKLTKRI